MKPEGFPRFLPVQASVVVVRVPRQSFDVLAPVLLPGREDALLLLPSADSERLIDRIRVRDGALPGRTRVQRAPSAPATTLRLGSRTLALGPAAQEEPVASGAHAFALEIAGRTRPIVGVLDVPEGAGVELRVEESDPIATITTHVP